MLQKCFNFNFKDFNILNKTKQNKINYDKKTKDIKLLSVYNLKTHVDQFYKKVIRNFLTKKNGHSSYFNPSM